MGWVETTHHKRPARLVSGRVLRYHLIAKGGGPAGWAWVFCQEGSLCPLPVDICGGLAGLSESLLSLSYLPEAPRSVHGMGFTGARVKTVWPVRTLPEQAVPWHAHKGVVSTQNRKNDSHRRSSHVPKVGRTFYAA